MSYQIDRKLLKRLVKVNKRDVFWNHLLLVFSFSYDSDFFGEIKSNQVSIWKKTRWLGVFYPVFIFDFDNQDALQKYSTRINSVGRTFFICISAALTLLFIPSAIDHYYDNGFWIILGIGFLFMVLYFIASISIYNFEKKQLINEVFNKIGVQIEKGREVKEWSFKALLMRLFAYPFCVLILWFVFEDIYSGNYSEIMLGGLFALVYLYYDLSVLFKKK